jgi:hypothetical protein
MLAVRTSGCADHGYVSSGPAAHARVRCDNPHSSFPDPKAMTDNQGPQDASHTPEKAPASAPRERATPEGDELDPTRYGDWEKNGRCIDF